MAADAIEYGDWKLGIRAGGFVFGTMALVTKVAIGVGNAMVGFILGLTGYVAGATVQTHATQLAIKAMFLHLPLLMFVFMGLILLGYDLDRRYSSIAAELQVRRSAAS
jgi:GPH family glycoside/pentoside/hexuronide:cation symporter